MAKRTETRPSVRRARRTQSAPNDGARANGEVAVAITGDLLAQGTELTRESLRSVGTRDTRLSRDVTSASVAEEKTADVTDELGKAGPAFGDFVEKIGLAVAHAQSELDKTFVSTAKELSSQKIKVISVFEQQLKDSDGTLEAGVIHESELPLINYLMPVGYKWSRVYLESDMKVSEFKSDVGFKIQSKSTSVGVSSHVGFGIGGLGGGAAASFGHSQSETGMAASTSVDTAAGSMHMEATLEPRNDITLPQPFILQKGPRLQVTLEKMNLLQETQGTGNDAKVVTVGREAEIKIVLYKKTGEANGDKIVEFKVDQAQVLIDVPSTKTNATTGEMTIKLSRKGPSFDPAKPLSTTLRVWFGFVNETMTISL